LLVFIFLVWLTVLEQSVILVSLASLAIVCRLKVPAKELLAISQAVLLEPAKVRLRLHCLFLGLELALLLLLAVMEKLILVSSVILAQEHSQLQLLQLSVLQGLAAQALDA